MMPIGQPRPHHPCGRIDQHPAHEWTRPRLVGHPSRTYGCKGTPVTEGGQPCVGCQRPDATCRCQDELEAERAAEWWAS
jgi:hypothetical protein